MIRHSFEITFEDVRTNECDKQEFISYSEFTRAWLQVSEYAISVLMSRNKYYVIKNIEYTNMR